jgi:hypothetical protein
MHKIHNLTGNEYLDACQAALKSRAPLSTACDAYSVMAHADRAVARNAAHVDLDQLIAITKDSEWATAEFYRLGGHAGMRAEKAIKDLGFESCAHGIANTHECPICDRPTD